VDRLWRMTAQPAAAARSAIGKIAQPHGKPESGAGAGGGAVTASDVAVGWDAGGTNLRWRYRRA